MNTTTCERGSTELQRTYSAGRQQHHVSFFCDAPGAKTVTLTGDFNGWNPAATRMHRTPDGRWMVSLELHHGHHRYLFLVDGNPRLTRMGAESLATTGMSGSRSSPSVDDENQFSDRLQETKPCNAPQ